MYIAHQKLQILKCHITCSWILTDTVYFHIYKFQMPIRKTALIGTQVIHYTRYSCTIEESVILLNVSRVFFMNIAKFTILLLQETKESASEACTREAGAKNSRERQECRIHPWRSHKWDYHTSFEWNGKVHKMFKHTFICVACIQCIALTIIKVAIVPFT